ncbi:MAG TPA: hypothetical protein VNF47_10420 [Streptosporangiaceae bacterium]|nr:hypothetical protein [Streptosporangiaceae bacterium]
MLVAEDPHGGADVQFVAGVHNLRVDSGFSQDCGARDVTHDPAVRVAVTQCPDLVDIKVVAVDMGDQNASDSVEPVQADGEAARVDEQPGTGLLEHQAALAKLAQPHLHTLAHCRCQDWELETARDG